MEQSFTYVAFSDGHTRRGEEGTFCLSSIVFPETLTRSDRNMLAYIRRSIRRATGGESAVEVYQHFIDVWWRYPEASDEKRKAAARTNLELAAHEALKTCFGTKQRQLERVTSTPEAANKLKEEHGVNMTFTTRIF